MRRIRLAPATVSKTVPPRGTQRISGSEGGAPETWYKAKSCRARCSFWSVGLETRIKDLISVGGGRPAIAYFIAQGFNVLWTLLIVWILWSGTFFTPPILPD